MSIDGIGIVIFGVKVEEERLPFPWPPERQDEEDLDEDEAGDLGAYLARRNGIVNPYDNPGPGYDIWDGWAEGEEPADWSDRTELWSSSRRKAESDAPIEIESFGHYEGSSLYVVALKGTAISNRESSKARELILPTVDPARIDEAAAFCRIHEICPFDEPKWLLGSHVG